MLRAGGRLLRWMDADLSAQSYAGRRRETVTRGGEPCRPALRVIDTVGLWRAAEEAKKLVEIGFHELIFALPPAPADKVLPMLDSYTAIKRKLGA